MKKKYNIEVDCAACAAKVEEAISSLPDVNSVSINFLTQKMSLDADDSCFPGILELCLRTGRKVEPEFDIEF
jgi:copper chaperone CopZ